MGEDVREVLAGRIDRIEHVQVAGYPGRNEPGTGTFDCADVMLALDELGYNGRIGLEYFPTMPSQDSFAATRRALGA